MFATARANFNDVLAKNYGLIIIIFFVLNLLLFWPGQFSWDTHMQLKQVKSGVFSDHHPPVMAWLWGVLYHHFIQQTGILLVFHLTMFWGGIYNLGKALQPTSPWLAYACIGIWLAPPIMGMTATLWKDSGMSCAYLLACGLILRSSLGNKPITATSFILIFLALFYGTAVRHNAIAALLPLCMLFSFALKKNLKVPQHIALSFILFLAVINCTMLFNYAVIDKYSNYKQQTILAQLIGMSVHTGTMLVPEDFVLKHATSNKEFLKKARFSYVYVNTDSLSTDNPQDTAQLKAAFIEMVIDHPWKYIQYRSNMIQHILRWNIKYLQYPYVLANNNLSSFQQVANNYLRNKNEGLWFRPWFYLACSFIFLALLCINKKPLHTVPARQEIMFVLTSGIFYMLPYSLLLSWSDFRYSFWLVVAFCISFLLILNSIFIRIKSSDRISVV